MIQREETPKHWFGVGTSQVQVLANGGGLYVQAVDGVKHQLKEPATAAEAKIMMEEAKRICAQHRKALSKDYLTNPMSLMQLYLAIITLLVKWEQLQSALFVATIKSSSTYYYGRKRCLLNQGMVHHRAKFSKTLLPIHQMSRPG